MRIQDLSQFLFSLELKDKLVVVGIHSTQVSETYLDIESYLSTSEVDAHLTEIVPNFAWMLKAIGRKTKGTIRIVQPIINN